MEPEKYIFDLIPELLKKYDKKKKGATLDIGVGTFNFYFEVFYNAGYKTYAIEPLPSANLREITTRKNIPLIEACIVDYEGTVNIYSGIFNNENCSDVSSINNDWWGINENSKSTVVKAQTLRTIIDSCNISSITYMKIDTEGSEYSIINQLVDFEDNHLPKIIEFEYGGGAKKNAGTGGWSKNYFEKTLECLKACHKLGYIHLLLFESVNEAPIEFDLDNINNYANIFGENYVYGNVMMFQKKIYSFERILSRMKPTFLEKLVGKFLK